MQELRQLARRVSVMINRNVFSKVENAASKNQLWIAKGVHEQDKEVEVFEPYGLSTSPLQSAELLRFALDGYEEHSIALGATGGTQRPRNLQAGEVRLYGSGNAYIQILGDTINLVAGGNTVSIADAGLTSNKNGTFNGISVDSHTHDGVSTGIGNTGQPN